MLKIIYLITITLTAAVLLIIGCNKSSPPTQPPPDEEPKIEFTLEGKTCTEALIKLKVENILNAAIFRDDSLLINIPKQSIDTTIYEEKLLPKTDYNYKVTVEHPLANGNSKTFSKELLVQTLDTTSQNFTYQIWEFGEITNNHFYDVSIINDNDIWVVGLINSTELDSENTYINYNAVHWDGVEWTRKRIPFIGCGAVIYPIIYSVQAFNENDILFLRDGSLVHYDGQNYFNHCDIHQLLTHALLKIWAKNYNDIYCVGERGNSVFYNGQNWMRVNGNTGLYLLDIYSTGNGEVYTSGVGDQFHTGGDTTGILLKGNSGGFTKMVEGRFISEAELFNPYLIGDLATVWVDENNSIYTGGHYLYQYRNNKWDYVHSLVDNHFGGNFGAYQWGYINSIRGNASNDYIIAGERNTIRHFNGISWTQLGMPYSFSSGIIWRRVETKNNIAVACGYRGDKAIIIRLKR
jgi:hypothetical protein